MLRCKIGREGDKTPNKKGTLACSPTDFWQSNTMKNTTHTKHQHLKYLLIELKEVVIPVC